MQDYLAASLNRQSDMERLIRRLWARIEEQQILLASALHQLYDAKDPRPSSRERFVNEWHAERRHMS